MTWWWINKIKVKTKVKYTFRKDMGPLYDGPNVLLCLWQEVKNRSLTCRKWKIEFQFWIGNLTLVRTKQGARLTLPQESKRKEERKDRPNYVIAWWWTREILYEWRIREPIMKWNPKWRRKHLLMNKYDGSKRSGPPKKTKASTVQLFLIGCLISKRGWRVHDWQKMKLLK